MVGAKFPRVVGVKFRVRLAMFVGVKSILVALLIGASFVLVGRGIIFTTVEERKATERQNMPTEGMATMTIMVQNKSIIIVITDMIKILLYI